MQAKKIIISIAVMLAIAVSAFTIGRITAPVSDAVITITATELMAEYYENPNKADAKYTGKTLIVTGETSARTDHQFENFTLHDYDMQRATGYKSPSISCNYSYAIKDRMVQNVKGGETATIKGICGGYEIIGDIVFIQLFNCDIVK